MATAPLADLVARGLDTTQGVLCVLDGSKALRKAVRDVLGACTGRALASVTRSATSSITCLKRDRAGIRRRLRGAWAERDHARALDRLEQLVQRSVSPFLL